MKFVAALVCAVTLNACTQAVSGTGDRARSGATVLVDNQSPLEITIHANVGPQRVRLGQARPLQITALRIPSDLVSGRGVRFTADATGRTQISISEEILVWPGDTVEVRIPRM